MWLASAFLNEQRRDGGCIQKDNLSLAEDSRLEGESHEGCSSRRRVDSYWLTKVKHFVRAASHELLRTNCSARTARNELLRKVNQTGLEESFFHH